MTCDESVREDLGLETLKRRRDLRRLKWYRKVMGMNSNGSPIKLLLGQSNKMFSFWFLAGMGFRKSPNEIIIVR